MFTGLFDPAFLQAACAHATPTPPPPEPNEIKIGFGSQPTANPLEISCTGEITVEYIASGVTTTKTFTNLNEGSLDGVIPDANTDVVITGDVTMINWGSPRAGTILTCDLSKCKTLTSISGVSGSNITTLIMPKDDQLVTYCDFEDLESLNSVSCKADNQTIANGIASAISQGVNNGTLYTDSAGAYYSTLETAATAKGWTIQPLS